MANSVCLDCNQQFNSGEVHDCQAVKRMFNGYVDNEGRVLLTEEEKCTCGHAMEQHFFGYEEHCKEMECKCERYEKR